MHEGHQDNKVTNCVGTDGMMSFVFVSSWKALSSADDERGSRCASAASFVARNSSYFDPYWTVAPPLACGWLAFDAEPGASDTRTALVSLLVMVWAVRLTGNWVRTWGGLGHEDWRYVEIQKKTGKLYWLASLVGARAAYQAALSLSPGLPAARQGLRLVQGREGSAPSSTPPVKP